MFFAIGKAAGYVGKRANENIFLIFLKKRLTILQWCGKLDHCIKLYYGVKCAQYLWVRGNVPNLRLFWLKMSSNNALYPTHNINLGE